MDKWSFDDASLEGAEESSDDKDQFPQLVPPESAADPVATESRSVVRRRKPGGSSADRTPNLWDPSRPLRVLVWGLADQGKTAYLWAVGKSLPSSSVDEFHFGELCKDSRTQGRGFQTHWNALSDRLEKWQRTVSNFTGGDFESGHFMLFHVRRSGTRPSSLLVQSIDLPGEAVADSEGHRGYGGQKDTKYKQRAAEIRKHADVCLLMIRADKLEAPGRDRIRVERFLKDSIFSLVRSRRPVAVVLTAVDAISDPNFREAMLDRSLPLHLRQEAVHEYLRLHVPQLVDRVVNQDRYAFFGVSAWGPDAVDPEDKFHIRDPHPRFVEEPLVWSLRKGWGERAGLWKAKRVNGLLRLVTIPAALAGLAVGIANWGQGIEARTNAGFATGLAEKSADLFSREGSLRDARIRRLFQSIMAEARDGATSSVEESLDKLYQVPGGKRYASRAAMYAIQATLTQMERRSADPKAMVARLDAFGESPNWMAWLDSYDQVQFNSFRVRTALRGNWLDLEDFSLAEELTKDPLFALEHGPDLAGTAIATGLAGCADESGFARLIDACKAFFAVLSRDQIRVVEDYAAPFLVEETVRDLTENPTRADFRIRFLQEMEYLGAANVLRGQLVSGLNAGLQALLAGGEAEGAFQMLKRVAEYPGLLAGLGGPMVSVYETKVVSRNQADAQYLLSKVRPGDSKAGSHGLKTLASADFWLAHNWLMAHDSLNFLLEEHWLAYESHWREAGSTSVAGLRDLVSRHRFVLDAAQVPIGEMDSLNRQVSRFLRASVLDLLRARSGEADDLLEFGLDLLLASENGQVDFTRDWVELLVVNPSRFNPYPLATWVFTAKEMQGLGRTTQDHLNSLAEGLSRRLSREKEMNARVFETREGLGLSVALVLLSSAEQTASGPAEGTVVDWMRSNSRSFLRKCDPSSAAVQLIDLSRQRPVSFQRIIGQLSRETVEKYATDFLSAAREAQSRDELVVLLAAALSLQDPQVCRLIQEEIKTPSIALWADSGSGLLGTVSRSEEILTIRGSRDLCAPTLAVAVSEAVSTGFSAARESQGAFSVVSSVEGIREQLGIQEESRWLTRSSLGELSEARLALAAQSTSLGDLRNAHAYLRSIAAEEKDGLGRRYAQEVGAQLRLRGPASAFEVLELLARGAQDPSAVDLIAIHLEGIEHLLTQLGGDVIDANVFPEGAFEGGVLRTTLALFNRAERPLGSTAIGAIQGMVEGFLHNNADLETVRREAPALQALLRAVSSAAHADDPDQDVAELWSGVAWRRIQREPEDERYRLARSMGVSGDALEAATTQAIAQLCRAGRLPDAVMLADGLENPGLREEWKRTIDSLEGMVFVRSGAFFMSKHEVTVNKYREFLRAMAIPGNLERLQQRFGKGITLEELEPGNTRIDFTDARMPVQKISWRAAEAFCWYFGGQLPSARQFELAIADVGGWPVVSAGAQSRNRLTAVSASQPGLTGLLVNAPEYIRDTDRIAVGQHAVGDPRPIQSSDIQDITFDLPASQSEKRPFIGFRMVMSLPLHLVKQM